MYYSPEHHAKIIKSSLKKGLARSLGYPSKLQVSLILFTISQHPRNLHYKLFMVFHYFRYPLPHNWMSSATDNCVVTAREEVRTVSSDRDMQNILGAVQKLRNAFLRQNLPPLPPVTPLNTLLYPP